MATGATGIGDSSKRTADSAGLNEGGERAHRSDKVRHVGQYAGFHLTRSVFNTLMESTQVPQALANLAIE